MQPPLPEQLRPSHLNEIFGQDHLVGRDGFVTKMINSKRPLSVILWGPPGTGKTSMARLFAKAFDMQFRAISPIFSGVADLKKIIKEIEETPLFSKGTLLFVDEIHRFNRAQQDAFLPYLERGTFVLVGATAENPSFYLNNALLSRLRVLTLNSLSDTALNHILERYEEKRESLNLSEEARKLLLSYAGGDGRYLLHLVENLESLGDSIDIKTLESHVQKRSQHFDQSGDQHYNLISALHKSVRGSDPESALYWLSRMLTGGEDPRFIIRRLIRMASEDVGLADPQALTLAISAKETFEMLGSPEGELALAQVVIYLSLAPKSNALYLAEKKAKELAASTSHLPPPSHIINAPTQMMKELGFGENYHYDHDAKNAFSGQNYFPDGIERTNFYNPVSRGFEREMQKRIEYFNKLRENYT
ncbi:MAG: replication-associated recombination protein A [Waddliaceae bacterium]